MSADGSADGSAERHAYGPHPSQHADLHRPAAVGGPTIVLLHGGFWRSRIGSDHLAPVASDLCARGWTVWNLEYRRVSEAAWPATLADVAAGIDHLAELGQEPRPVVAVGHSAGGHLGVWAAGRHRLPPGAPGAGPVVRVDGVVALAGVLDVEHAARTGVGGRAAPDLIGGPPDEHPERYRLTNPVDRLPIGVPVRCVHARADDRVPFEMSVRYVERAREAGDDATLTEVPGDHFTVVDPTDRSWPVVLDRIAGLVEGAGPQ